MNSVKNEDEIIEPISYDTFMSLITTYYSIKERTDLNIKCDISLRYNKSILEYILKPYIDSYVHGSKVTVFLRKSEILAPLNEYIAKKYDGYSVSKYECVGRLETVGTYIKNSVPYVTSINLHCNKTKKLVRK